MKKCNFLNCLLALTLALSVILSSLVFIAPVTVSAEETEIQKWSGNAAENFAGGDGTAANPYKIENADQLFKLVVEFSTREASLGKFFEITNDIYLNDVVDGTAVSDLANKRDWLAGYGDTIAAPTKDLSFAGTLEGNGHTIYGLYVGSVYSAGLFPGVSSGVNIKNLTMDNLYIEGNNGEGYAGAFAGQLIYKDWNYKNYFTNCGVTNAVIGSRQFIGGIVAQTESCNVTFTDCYSYATDFTAATAPGGIMGTAWQSGAKLINCYSAGYFPVRSDNSYAACTNVYTNVPVPAGNTTAGITVFSDAEMKGTAAKTNMAGFDFVFTWKTVKDGYPVFSNIEIWDGSIAKDYAGGDGSYYNPYLIENGAQLFKMAKENTATVGSTYEYKYFKITKDIYLNKVTDEDMEDPTVAAWDAKGFNTWLTGYNYTKSTGFCGSVDGGGHIIHGMYSKEGTYSALFASAIGKVEITNLHLRNSFSRAGGNGGAGGIVGIVNSDNKTYPTSVTVSYSSVDNCFIFSDNTSSWRNGAIVGGGANEYGKIVVSNCYVTNTEMKVTNTQTANRTCAFIGNTNQSGHQIINCFTDGDSHPVTDATDKSLYDVIRGNKTYKNVYTCAPKPDCDTYGDIIYLTEEQMKGENAKTYMPTLSFKYSWEIVENDYSVINVREDVWDGSSVASHSDFEGQGTEKEPYIIKDGAQLYYAAIGNSNLADGSYYKLANDIILNDSSLANWESFAHPWGMNKAKRFNGTLDGDGHTIEGLYINTSSTEGRYGLFSYVGQDSGNKIAELKNITFTGASINHTTTSTSFRGVAVVAGQASGKTNFENIYVDETCKVNAPNVTGVAGIVAHSYNNSSAHVTISNSAVLADINGAGGVGAFAGRFTENASIVITINDSFAATDEGFVGTSIGTVTINNGYSNVVNSVDNGATQVDAANMKGKAAKQNMPKLDFYFVWKTVENGYPVLRPLSERLEAWDGSVATTLEGEGTKANPYKISNGAELYYAISTYSNQDYATLIENKPYFEITADINLGNNQWYNVAKRSYPDKDNYATGFAGVIYGNGHTVYNLASSAKLGVAGLIPVATQGTEIYDLHLKGGNLPKADWDSYANGGLIGLAVATVNSTPITISGCSVEDYTISSRDASAAFVAITYSQSIIIKNSYAVNNTISATNTNQGFENGSAFVAVQAEGNGNGNSITVENCFTDMSAKFSCKKAMSISYKNVYTTDESYDNSVAGLTKLAANEIMGDAARENLDGFNFNTVWKVVEGGYPVHEDLEIRSMYWNGTAADGFAGGNGTEVEPYLITNAKELYLLANLDRDATLGKFYKLANNIAISNVYDGWANDDPYTWAVKKAYLDGFTYSSSFAGTLDGAGYTVYGLYYNNAIVDDGNYAYGLIPFVTADAVIKDITVSDVSANVLGDGAYVGAVAGAAHVMKEDIENTLLHAIQFVGVNTTNVVINAANKGDILGGASYGVKFEICSTENDIHGEIKDYFVEVDCNNDTAYSKDTVTVNALNINAETLETIRAIILGNDATHMVTLDMNKSFDISDLVIAKHALEVAAPDEYLVWSDEFNGNALDTSVWTQSNTTMSTGTTLKYTDTATFDGNNIELNINKTEETDESGNPIYNINYGLSTANTMSYKYGRLEMRAKIPVGAGAFPALWLSSRSAIGYDNFSEYSTEIDIFEVFGKTASANTAVACIHKWYNDEDGTKNDNKEQCSCGTGAADGNGYKIEESDRSKTISYDWYKVEFEWTVDTMSFWIYKDGEARPEKAMYTATKNEMDTKSSFDYTSFRTVTGFDLDGYDTSNEGIFNQFMYPIITNHMYNIGKGYSGLQSEIDANLNNLTYEIDYLRLYQKNDGKSEINLK